MLSLVAASRVIEQPLEVRGPPALIDVDAGWRTVETGDREAPGRAARVYRSRGASGGGYGYCRAMVRSPSGCTVGPPVTTGGKAIAGRGVRSRLIGTITLKTGAKQVTYAGHPLYTYVAGSAPGQTFYVNVSEFGGCWPAVNAAGSEVE